MVRVNIGFRVRFGDTPNPSAQPFQRKLKNLRRVVINCLKDKILIEFE